MIFFQDKMDLRKLDDLGEDDDSLYTDSILRYLSIICPMIFTRVDIFIDIIIPPYYSGQF